MFEFIRANQLNIMLLLCGACAAMAAMLVITRFISQSRRKALIIMELMAFFLLWFDRLAYVYSGDVTRKGYVMVRLSNFAVFFLTSAIVLGFNIYLSDWLMHEGKLNTLPKRLKVVQYVSIIGMLLAVVSALTGLYYYFDEANKYHRGSGFLIAYIIPVICPILQYTVIRQNKKLFSRLIYISMVLYIFLPITCGIIQIFTYGISIVNMAMVMVSVFLYVFNYLDINDEVERAHKLELEGYKKEQKSMRHIFGQISEAFVAAIEKRDKMAQGHSKSVAVYARKIAEMCGKDEEECNRVYYAGMLHDVGMIGIPDEVIQTPTRPDAKMKEQLHLSPLIGREILSNISEYPYLSETAYSCKERYNGSGYPEGLKGEQIPEIARIVGVADDFVAMTTPKRYRDAYPGVIAREHFIKAAGEEHDPQFAGCMVRIIDSESNYELKDLLETVDSEMECGEYRDNVSNGIMIEDMVKSITFNCESAKEKPEDFSAPSIILYDSFDRKVHNSEQSIEGYHYLEYGEVWFDEHSITTAARKISEESIDDSNNTQTGHYEIEAAKYDDHMKLVMKGPEHSKEVIVALTNSSKSVYIGLTGEHCKLSDIIVKQTGKQIGSGEIPRIESEVNFTDRMEADVKNIQVDSPRAAYTTGVRIKDRMHLAFHTMSLPAADFIWHCPYIVLFYSDDGNVNGPNYHEYALIKLNGESDAEKEHAHNYFTMKKKDSFPGWDKWKELNLVGMECNIEFEKRGNRVTTTTENLGIYLENVTEISDDADTVYASLTGDQCALTDIRVQ